MLAPPAPTQAHLTDAGSTPATDQEPATVDTSEPQERPAAARKTYTPAELMNADGKPKSRKQLQELAVHAGLPMKWAQAGTVAQLGSMLIGQSGPGDYYIVYDEQTDTTRLERRALNLQPGPESPAAKPQHQDPSALIQAIRDIAKTAGAEIDPEQLQALDSRVAEIESSIQAMAESVQAMAGSIPSAVAAALMNAGALAPQITVTWPDATKTTASMQGKHKLLAEIIEIITDQAHDPTLLNLVLYGPAGTGKSTLAAHLAEALGLPFHLIPCHPRTSNADLFGPITPDLHSGEEKWSPSPLCTLYEQGGVLCLDEMFLADPGALAALNAGLAGHSLTVPRANMTIKRHPRFVFVGCDNSSGQGGGAMFAARQIADSATRDRCTFVYVGYDKAIDERIVSIVHDDKKRAALLVFIAHVRERTDGRNIRQPVGTRLLGRLAAGVAAGRPWDALIARNFNTWNEADRSAVVGTYIGPKP